ncbi:MAG: hypothetical protein Q9182_000853 [Xanthomendoza sp. 2 TL-2023]
MSSSARAMASFDTLEGRLDPALLTALRDMKFDDMSPVQEKVMSTLPDMGSDCLVQAKTGTGKTIAFLLPAIQNSLQNRPAKGLVSILIMSPTRELALQIAAEANLLVSKLRPALEVHTAFGGTAKASTLLKFQNGDPKILIATPGRLNDYMSDASVASKFHAIRSVILDEADRMLDTGFLPTILQILKALPAKRDANWQGMCFSATIPPKIQQVFSHVLEPNHVKISTIDASEPPTHTKVPQFSLVIPSVKDTFTSLYLLLQKEISSTVGAPKIVVFGTTARLVSLFAQVFQRQFSIPVFQLHSRLTQPARTRTTEEFKTATRGIMFASDVIGRGMDFPNVTLVLQVGLPVDADAYTHRVGRTARAGKDGRAIILLTEAESFYLTANPQFPITPYPGASKLQKSLQSPVPAVVAAMKSADALAKHKAYSAYLGFMKPFMSKLKLTPAALVQMANQFALEAMYCDEVPRLEKRVVGKMGLKDTPGLVYATGESQSSPARAAPPVPPTHPLKRKNPPKRKTY